MIKKLPGWKRGMIVGINIREIDIKREKSVGFFLSGGGQGEVWGFVGSPLASPRIPTNKFLLVAPTDNEVF